MQQPKLRIIRKVTFWLWLLLVMLIFCTFRSSVRTRVSSRLVAFWQRLVFLLLPRARSSSFAIPRDSALLLLLLVQLLMQCCFPLRILDAGLALRMCFELLLPLPLLLILLLLRGTCSLLRHKRLNQHFTAKPQAAAAFAAARWPTVLPC
jgi:hypothetical protein